MMEQCTLCGTDLEVDQIGRCDDCQPQGESAKADRYFVTIRLEVVNGHPSAIEAMINEALGNLMEHENSCEEGSFTNARVTAVLVEK